MTAAARARIEAPAPAAPGRSEWSSPEPLRGGREHRPGGVAAEESPGS